MIRIYLDWNIISGLKTEKYTPLLDFIKVYKQRLLFVYTPAHFNDLMKSYNPDNIHFNEDLDQLEWLCGNNLLKWIDKDWERPGLSPKVYFHTLLKKQNVTNIQLLQKLFSDAESDDHSIWNFGKLIKNIFDKIPSNINITQEIRTAMEGIFPKLPEGITQWEMMKNIIPFVDKLENDRESYKNHRKMLGEKGLKLEVGAGSWDTDEVLKKIDLFLKSHDQDLTFKQYVERVVSISNNENATIYEYFTTAYLLLDLIGFRSDKLPKSTDSHLNIRTDADHAFFASSCDYLVTNDKNLALKAKVLYKKFNVFTQVLMADQVQSELNEKMHFVNEDRAFINEALSLVNQSKLLQKHLKVDNPDLETDVCEFELPIFYFDFFTRVDTLLFIEESLLVLNFKRPYSTNYFFAFHIETERLIRFVLNFFGYQSEPNAEEKIRLFIDDTSEQLFKWTYDFGFVQLSRNVESREPELTYVIKI